MNDALLLTLLLLPLGGGLLVALMHRNDGAAKLVAFGFSILELVVACVAWGRFETDGDRLQLTVSREWIDQFGISFALGVDGIALVMIMLTAVLVPIVLGASWDQKVPEGRSQAGFFALVLALQSMLVGVFAATDIFLFYLFFEVMLVPMYFLIGWYGGPRRQYAAVKFFLYSLLGGLVMLASVIGVYVVTADDLPEGTFDWATLVTVANDIPKDTQIWLFMGFFVAFAIKAPLVPFHTWLPDAGAEAPVGAAVLLLGVMDKVGIYGFLRYCLPLFPEATRTLTPLLLVLAVVGVLYGALLAVGQSDMKRFVSYTSIAHFGFIAVGVFAFSTQAMDGAVLYMVNHGISTGMLFIVVGMLMARSRSRLIEDHAGIATAAPVLAGMFLLAGLSMLSLPGTNSFVSEFLVLIGSFPREPVVAIIATSGIILAALYVLWVYQQVFTGPPRGSVVAAAGGPGAATNPEGKTSTFPDLTTRDKFVLAPLVALVIGLGFYPQPVLDVIEPAVEATMIDVGYSDPVGPGGS